MLTEDTSIRGAGMRLKALGAPCDRMLFSADLNIGFTRDYSAGIAP